MSLLAIVALVTIVFFLQDHAKEREAHSPEITTSEFIKKVAPAAKREQQKYHIPASITIAQAGLESDWGKSKLAYKYNNLFGIKANSKKHRVRMYTTENVNGKDIYVKQYFQTYDSWADSIAAHTLFIVNGTKDDHHRFKKVMSATNYKDAAQALQDGGYATDPDYAKKLIYDIQKFHLDKYDEFK
ncbi:MAG: glycoside hydrolase family 73 protein [Limosilactobacillus sp.]|uniref:glycoside hydrolase family 73 protein n=1 Tax=Limosilactobacillus sp. TaxID=2773925 RepID=UPI0026F508AB|nr:glycoside hydrolase family 73 protein [Limosilactobacillus sp.]